MAATYTVGNATDFNNLPRLNAGDVVQMNSGTYGAINKTLESSISDDATAKNNPVLVYAVTPGGVVVNAPSKITLSGRGIILAGLDFNANSGILADYLVGTASGSRYMTLSHLRFNGCAAGAIDGKWINIQGFYATIEYCTLTERPETIHNTTVAFMPNLSEGGVAVPRLHKVRYCYFGPRYAVPQDTSSDADNGFESLRIGVGAVQTYDMQVTVERNVFYRSIWRVDGVTAGEPEIISIKSKGNKILNNTILESQGGICFRSGNGSTVEGNFIFGGGYYATGTSIALRTASANQGGIRVIGPDQIVRNNYIANVVGDGIRAALCVMSGESDYNPGDPANGIINTGFYQPADNAKIYNNTFISCKEMSLGLLSNDSQTNSSGVYVAKSPANVQMFNNVWQGGSSETTSAINRDTSVVSGYTPIVLGGSGANYIQEGSSGKYGWNGLLNSTYTTVSPLITTSFDNYKIPTASSPILNKATSILVATTDIRGLTRPVSNLDIGSFELEVTGSGLKPLLKSEVGVVFDGGPSSYPVAGSGDSRPNILTTSIAGGSVGTSFYQLMQASGGDGLIVWSISSGSLPLGLTLSGGGILSGTPTTIGSYTFTMRVTDSDSTGPDSAEKSFTLVVASAGGAKLSISTVKAYSTTSGKTSYSYDGNTSTRWSSTVKSKNPNTNGTNFGTDCTWIWWDLGENKNLSSVKLNWYNSSTRTYNYRIDSTTNTNSWATILARTNSATNGLTGGYETVNLASASGRYVRLVSWGNSDLNGWIHISEVEIYGSAIAISDPRKTQAILFGALDPVLQTDPPVALSAYSLSSENNTTGLPITYESSDPTVATIDGSTLTITGSGSTWITASQAGTEIQPGITAYQPAPSVQQILTVTQVTPGITSNTGATAVRGLPFRYQITANRDASSYGATGLPAGLVVDAVTGKISGTATVSGSFTVTLSAQNSAGTGTTTLNLNVVEPYVYETFENYTSGAAVPLVAPSSVTSGIKASGQITTLAGTSAIGGVGGKVAWFNDTSTGSSGQLEFNAGASGQSYLSASFELYNNATPAASGTMALAVSLVAWNANQTTAGGSSSKRIATIEFNQFGSLSNPAWTIKNSGTVASGTYAITSKQTVNLFANDHDSNSINYVGPDGNVRTLGANSFAVFLNNVFIGMYGLNLAAVDNSASLGVLLTGNNNLGRLGFNTSTGNTGNWLIDNVVVSDMPTDVVISAPAAPILTSPATASGQAGFAFNYITTNSELADSYLCDGVLPTGLSFNTSSGIISGSPNQSGTFPVTIYASNSAGTGYLDVTLNFSPAPPNIFTGIDPSMNTAASWSLGAAPNSSSSGGSYTDLVFASSATALTTTSGNINGKSYNVTNGSSYVFSSVRTNAADGTIYKIGATGVTEPAPFTNTVTGVTNQLAYLANNSRITFSRLSPSNNVSSILQLRNSGTLQIEAGSTLDIQTDISQTAPASAFGWTKMGRGTLKLSGSNSYTGTSIVQEGTLVLAGQGSSAVTVKSNSILEIALTNPGTATFSNSAAVSLESGSKVWVTGTPADGATYTLVSASSMTSLATLESSVSGYQLAVFNNSLQLQPVVAPTFASSSLAATGAANSAFTYQIIASGSPTSYGAIGLPGWASLNTLTGTITGTPNSTGTSTVTISATNDGGTVSSTLTLTVNGAVAAPVITSTNSASGTVGSAFSYQITASNNPTSFGASNLPAGLSNNSTTGLISGTPTVAGTNSVILSASNTGGTGTNNLTLTIGSDYFALIRSRRSSSLIADGLAASSVSSISSKAYGYWKANTPSLNTTANSSSTALWSDLPLTYPSAVTDAATASGNMVTTFSRIEKMAQAWATPGCFVTVNSVTTTLTGNAELATAIINALDWMVANNYTSTATQYGNWFDWEVQGAQNFVDAQILIYSQLSAAQIASYAAAVDNYGPNSTNNRDYFSWGPLTGANTTSVALVATLRGALAKDASKIAEINGSSAVPEIFPPVTDGDGFYTDGSYVFHGNVAYNGHYGYVMLEAVTILTALLDGTPWTIVDSNYSYVYDWITDGFMPFYYHGSFMDCVRGRSVGTSGETGPDVGEEILGYIQTVANTSSTPTEKKTIFSNFVANPQPATGQYHFYNMDRVVGHRANFSIALSMSSTRINNYEDLFADANTHGYFQGDGMTYLYVGSKDTQFVNGYWPSVDYYHLTGTTTEQGTVSTPSATDQSFVGGADVQDSNGFPAYGVAAFSFHPALKSGTSTLYGKKSYFMFKDEVVCLGSGITAASANEIHTTVENRAMGSSVSSATLWVNGVQTSRALSSSATLSSLSSCAIEGLGGYYFYNSPGNVQASFEQNSGTWGAIHPGDSDTATYTDNYLKLYFNHGGNPANATYAYAILPTMAPSAVAGYARNPQSTIVANTTSIQAVKNSVLGTVAANFWGSSGGTADIITANRGCSVITYETAGRMSVGISDPTQSLSGPNATITVTLNRAATGTIAVDSGVTVVRTTPTIQLQANVAGLHGATLHASFSLEPVPVITSNANMVGINGKPLSFQVAANGSPTLYGAVGLPDGLSINSASGVISGSPTENGTFMATLSAANSAGTGYANLTITVAGSASNISATYGSTTTWVCPANVTAVQVEAWGAGGAGGSAIRGTSKAAMGGGGAGGAYAQLNSFPVVSGRTYYINIGTGGVSSTNNLATVPGGDSWFNSNNVISTLVLAKGGAGGQSIVTTTTDLYGTGGTGTISGSIGDMVRAGGNGATSTTNGCGGGGGGSAGILSAGNAPASTTNGLGALAVTGGGNGGNANATAGSSGDGQSPTGSPGGGGGGARSASTAQKYGGTGAVGQVILTIQDTAKVTQTITFGLDSATATVGDLPRTLIATSSAAGLEVTLTSSDTRVATITSGNTLNIVGVGTATITATQTGDGNYEAAMPVSVSLTVSASGFASWNGGSATMTSPILLKYALGGASSSTGVSEATTSSLESSTFTMTAVVRTDDSSKLSIVPKATTSLSATWDYPVTTTGEIDGVSQAGVATGCERKIFTVSRASNTKIFMKIEVSYTP